MVSSKNPNPRRRSILEAALECFSTDGYDSTSIESICAISGSSVGSLYHHFGNKEGVAAALYEEGIISYQVALVDILGEGGPPGKVAEGIVRHHLTWVRTNPEWARYLLQMGAAPATATVRPSVRRHNKELLLSLEEWSAPHIAGRRMVDLSPPTLAAVLLGPCHAVARAWLAGGSELDDETINTIAAAARRSIQPD